MHSVFSSASQRQYLQLRPRLFLDMRKQEVIPSICLDYRFDVGMRIKHVIV